MTLRIFKDGGNEVKTITRVMHVMSHSVATGNDGIDIEIHKFNLDDSFEIERIHINRWDFWSIDI